MEFRRVLFRSIVAIAMGYGECYLFTGIITAGKGALAVFNSESDVAAHELDVAIAHQRAGKQARFSQYLKAVADADDGDAALCRFHHGPHDRRTCGPCAGAQIIAIGEAEIGRLNSSTNAHLV